MTQNSAQHSALQQGGRVHSERNLRALLRALRACCRVVVRLVPTFAWPVATPSAVSQHQGPCRDTSPPAMPRPGPDTKSRSRSLGSQALSHHHMPCRDTTLAHSGAFRSQHQKPCRDTRFGHHASFVLRHPNDCPRHDLKNHVSTKDQPGPSPFHVVTQNLMS